MSDSRMHFQMDDRLAARMLEGNIVSTQKSHGDRISLLEKLAVQSSVIQNDVNVMLLITILGRLGIRVVQKGQNIEVRRDGVDHAHGLVRWASDGGSVFELPDICNGIFWVTIRGVLEDPLLYSLSADGQQLVFDDAVPEGWDIVAMGDIRQL
jgi:hypothetical protein